MEAASAIVFNTECGVMPHREPRPGNLSRLPVGVERKLYRLVPTSDGAAKEGKQAEAAAAGTAGLAFMAKPVKPGDKLDSNTLYVDEIVLSLRQGAMFRYGLVEAPLPPGGEVEGTTWGLRIEGCRIRTAWPRACSRSSALPPTRWGMLSYHRAGGLAGAPGGAAANWCGFSPPGEFNLPLLQPCSACTSRMPRPCRA
ncbi:hypothetical protein ACU4GD_00735 [Cupriavidus basilensis]